jgi:uncharacterized NAD(P)/FAD-binding protein YdhS
MNIGIVGGGCSGTLVAVHLLKYPGPVSVRMVETRADLARGLAYSTDCPDHLLNVACGNMSALPASPSHLHEWLRANGDPNVEPDFFASRQVYGSYLGCLLSSAVESRPGAFQRDAVEAVDIDCSRSAGVVLTLSDGNELKVDRAVLALGNPPPARLVVDGLAPDDPRYYNSPFETGATDGLEADSPVLLVGSGLTAVDAVMALRARGHRGVVYMLSRHGQMPHPHTVYRKTCPAPPVQPGASLRAALRAVRAAAGRAADWRTVVDALRPVSNEVWSKFTMAEKRRFLRHLKVYWDVHRHRMAPQFGALLHEALRSGQVEGMAGRLKRVSAQNDCAIAGIALRDGSERRVAVRRIVNCTGPDRDYRRVANPIVQALFRRGLASSGPMGGGLRTNEHGALIDKEGQASDRLFTLGPPRSADLIETIAVPEIREQAQALARHLMATGQ